MTCDRSVVFVGTPVYSTTKAERHDITEILLKAKLNTITLTLLQINCEFDSRTENTQHWKKEVTFLYHFSVEITFLLAERPLPGLTIIQLWSTNFVLWVHVNPPVNFPPVKKIKYNKILTYILRSIFLEIPHLELPRWRKTPKDTNGKGECHI
jgi:hypothetical protein